MGRVRWVTAVWLWGWGLAAVAAADPSAPPPSIGALAVEASDAPVLLHLQDILGYSTRRHPGELAADRKALLAAARAGGEQQLVVVDGARGRVEVIRVADGSTLWRELPEPAERSPYAVAFVAAELLQLSMQAGAASADTGAQAAAPDAARTGTSLAFLLTAGAELRGSADLLYFRPALELGMSLHDRGSSLWFVAAVRAALFGSASHEQDGQRLELSQHDVGLGVGLGLRGRRFGLLGLLRGGVAIAGWELQGTPGSADSQLRGWFGAALRGQVNIVRSLGLFAEPGFAVTPLRSRYLGPDGVLLEPGRVDAVVLVGLSWDTGD